MQQWEAHQRARASARLRPDTSRTRCTHRISPARRVRLTDEADRATASCSQYTLRPLRGTAPDVGRYTRYGALHPLWGAAPDVGRYTRSEKVQCLRIGCSATFNKHFRGRAITPIISRRTPPKHCTLYVALHPMWGATPDVGRLHPLRRATPDQKRCNAYGSGAAPHATSIFGDARYSPDSASAHLPPSPWTPATAGLTVTLQPQSHTAP